MVSRKNSSSNKEKIYLSLLIILAFGVFVLFTVLNVKIFKRNAESERNLAAMEEELHSLDLRRTNLLGSIRDAKTGEYLERVAKEDLGLKKEGEKVVVYKVEAPEEEGVEEKKEEKTGFFEKILMKLGIK